ncbi:hypothetical protein [Ammoniphilus sp. CFH 90114]|uniref:hypothetical protein n=1 Tax=Ammoniphilus sp. CFH 90114 TaxID=2493665 RepID=UPI00100FA1B4|nr:hypothetical protein [Ammoniphilus sp. CFH 90114]RXT05783.1 hypothetical protein EIZ39_16905 [Ammoniphilus sp. CFH 90114]
MKKKNRGKCCRGNEIVCLSLPSPLNLVLLGIKLRLELPCLRLTSKEQISEQQIERLINLLRRLLGGLLGANAGNVSKAQIRKRLLQLQRRR